METARALPLTRKPLKRLDLNFMFLYYALIVKTSCIFSVRIFFVHNFFKNIKLLFSVFSSKKHCAEACGINLVEPVAHIKRNTVENLRTASAAFIWKAYVFSVGYISKTAALGTVLS